LVSPAITTAKIAIGIIDTMNTTCR